MTGGQMAPTSNIGHEKQQHHHLDASSDKGNPLKITEMLCTASRWRNTTSHGTRYTITAAVRKLKKAIFLRHSNTKRKKRNLFY